MSHASPAFPPVTGTLLLCLDLQPVFLGVISKGEVLRRRCSFLVEACACLGVPMAFTEQRPQKLGATDPAILARSPEPRRQFAKSTFSALADDGIREALRSLQVEHLLICGLETPICVYQTAIDAIDAQYQVTLLTDGLGARREGDARESLDALVRAGAHALPSETVFYAMLHDARHPSFRDFTKLVKAYA